MAARENQGLQIALIIFVILTIILIVSTFLLFRSFQDAQEKIKAITSDNDAKSKAAQLANAESEQYKSMIGAASTDKVEAVQDSTKKDIEKYSKNTPAADQNYRYLVKSLGTELANANTRITELTADNTKLSEKIKTDETAHNGAIAEYTKQLSVSTTDLANSRKDFNKTLAELDATKKELAKKFDDKRKEHDELTKETGEKIGGLTTENDKMKKLLKDINLEKMRGQKANEVADGKVTWVNQRSRSVWINLGSDDGLRQQTSFSVFAADQSNPRETETKGKVEVIRVIDRHLAEARIVDDNLSNPIMPGDQIFSPTWEPGRPEHFGLAGVMDIDSDGTSDRQRIRDLIALNGGVIDEDVDDKTGKKTGEMSINTKYLVLGDPPKIGSTADKDAKISAYSDIIGEAQVLGVKTISVREFLDYMGYKPEDRTVGLGRKAKSADFAPRLPGGVQRVSPGSKPKELRRVVPATK